MPQVWEGETFTANYKDCAWGLGAWGVNGVQTWSHPDEADRVAWLQEAKEVLEAGTFPRLKLSLYFDASDANSNTGSVQTLEHFFATLKI